MRLPLASLLFVALVLSCIILLPIVLPMYIWKGIVAIRDYRHALAAGSLNFADTTTQ